MKNLRENLAKKKIDNYEGFAEHHQRYYEKKERVEDRPSSSASVKTWFEMARNQRNHNSGTEGGR